MLHSQQPPGELDTLVEITEILTGRLPFLEKCESVLDVLSDFTDSDIVTLREFDSENSSLDLIACYLYRLDGDEFQVPHSVPDSLLDAGHDSESPVILSNTSSVDEYRRAGVGLGMDSTVLVPIHVDGELFGVLGFGSISQGHYQEETVRIVVAIAAMVGMMIAKAELQEINEIEANIGRIINSPWIVPGVFERSAREIAKVIEFDRLMLNSVNLVENTFTTEFLLGEQVSNHPIGVARDIGGTVLEHIVEFREGRSFRLDGSEDTKFPRAQPFIDDGQPFLAGVPLIVGAQIVGTMGFIRGSQPFSKKDMAKCERLGNLLAGAFADFKSQEYRDQVEREIIKNRNILEVEAAIGRILSSPWTRADAAATLKYEINKVISHDYIVIVSVDTETEKFTKDFQDFLYDPILMNQDDYGESYSGSITACIVETGKGQITNFDDARLTGGELHRATVLFDHGYKSTIAVPLVFGDKIIGSMVLASQQEKVYGEADLAVAVRIGNLLAGALATFKITTERNRAQQHLMESEARFRQIADSIGGVFWLMELNPHRLIYGSTNFEDVWSVPISEVYQDYQQIFRHMHPDDVAQVQHASQRADFTGEVDIEYRVIEPNGSTRWIRSRGFPIEDGDGKIFRMSGIAEDITERKIQLERITEGGRLLSIGELASGLAHEINNPLASINLYSESLIDQDLPESAIADLKVISSQGKRAAGIVRNLLQFARKSSPETTWVNSIEFIDRCVGLKNHDFRINSITTTVNILLEHPEIAIDEQLMTQVLVNILSNAEQACVEAHAGGHISISIEKVDEAIRICVADDGPGIPPENQMKIFDPFFTTKEVGVGTGLGLSVSYGIIAQLGGRIWVESDGQSGAAFFIEISQPAPNEIPGLPNP